MTENEALKVLEQRAFQLREEIKDRRDGDLRRASGVAKAKKELETQESEHRSWVEGTHRLIQQRTQVDKAIAELQKAEADPDDLGDF